MGNNPVVIARYLPQFHEVEENNKWWGEGFTEWTAVKKAKALFNGHNQPKVPLENNYYNLLEKETMIWQSELAHKYGIDVFSFYHYWFKDGRQILEKPAENLLKWKDIDMDFCFTWANETWTRTWSKLKSGNSWTSDRSFESNANRDYDNGVLLDQMYGVEKDWIRHIEYLIPFFKDDRYIKYENKPVFIIYKPNDIHCLADMLSVWNNYAKLNGFDGIYIIGEYASMHDVVSSVLDAKLLRFPSWSLEQLNKCKLNNLSNVYDYDEMWKYVLKKNWYMDNSIKNYICADVSFDATPRHGEKALVLLGASPKKFKYYFSQLMKFSAKNNIEYVFINAWNEWGEGMYLEPDEENGYGYLEAVRYAKDHELDDNDGVEFPKELIYTQNEYNGLKVIADRRKRLWNALDILREMNRKKINIISYFLKNNIKKIAVYGYGYMGNILLEELEEQNVSIEYIIDRKKINNDKYKVCLLSKNMPKVDLIVVTPIGIYDEISKEIHKCVNYKTISFEQILLEYKHEMALL